MSTMRPEPCEPSNLSCAWADLFLRTYDASGGVAAPAIISIDEFEIAGPKEDSIIRSGLDVQLDHLNKVTVSHTAMMIFPYRQWLRHSELSCDAFTAWYRDRFLKRLKARDVRNKKGTYFERMVGYTGVRRRDG